MKVNAALENIEDGTLIRSGFSWKRPGIKPSRATPMDSTARRLLETKSGISMVNAAAMEHLDIGLYTDCRNKKNKSIVMLVGLTEKEKTGVFILS